MDTVDCPLAFLFVSKAVLNYRTKRLSCLLKPQQPGNGHMAEWYLKGSLTVGSEYSQLGNSWKWFPHD